MVFRVIKIWDLRKNYTAYRQEPIASKSFLYPGSSTRKLGKPFFIPCRTFLEMWVFVTILKINTKVVFSNIDLRLTYGCIFLKFKRWKLRRIFLVCIYLGEEEFWWSCGTIFLPEHCYLSSTCCHQDMLTRVFFF